MPPPRRARSAFTVLETLIVIAIIGILLAISIPYFKRGKESEARKVMATELRRLAVAQQRYRDSTKRYASDAAGAGITPRAGVTLTVGGAGVANGAGWNAIGESTQLPGQRCYIGVGIDSVVAGVPMHPGAVTCPERVEK